MISGCSFYIGRYSPKLYPLVVSEMQAMLRVVLLVVLFFRTEICAAAPVSELHRAFEAIEAQDWTDAFKIAKSSGPLAEDIVLWHYLRQGEGSFQQTARFLHQHPDWPGLKLLRKQSEAAFARANPADVAAFFETTPPQTGTGALIYAKALTNLGRSQSAQKTLVTAWRTLRLSAEEEMTFMARHRTLLKPHHNARLDWALWQGWRGNAKSMLAYVSKDAQNLGKARLGLMTNARGVDGLIAAVAGTLKNDPGLAHARFAWRLRKGLTDRAITLLIEHSRSKKTLGHPEKWAQQRHVLVRELMGRKKYRQAYNLASSHHLDKGAQFATLEWLSGFLALRRLKQPDLAIRHFTKLKNTVETPISLGRAGYWLGRAYSATGDRASAKLAYSFAAQHQSSFYGLLAAEKAGSRFDKTLAGRTQFPNWVTASFTKSSVFKAGLLLLTAEQPDLAERFLTHMSESLNADELGQLGTLLAELRDPHLQVMVGKRAAQYGHIIAAPYYALHPLINTSHPVAAELMLAIARRESEFNPTLVSGAGARGLMQILPGTAKETAKEIKIKYNVKRLLTDWKYNATIGGAYLAKLSRRFDGNPVLIAAAYNAGPSRTKAWIKKQGDPRKKSVDVIDWIETIPYAETRNYIMRVTESLPIYRARLGRKVLPVSFSKELAGGGLLPLSQ